MVSLLKKISQDLSVIKMYARINARETMTVLLDKVATTTERQQIWRLADGSLSNEKIAEKVGVTLRSVQYFVQEAENAGLIVSERRGYPKRTEDVIPSRWKTSKQRNNKEDGGERLRVGTPANEKTDVELK